MRVTIACSCIIFLVASPFICFSYERVVKLEKGETVAEIGKRDEFYDTWNEEIRKEIIKANPKIINIDKIKAGTEIILPYLPKYESADLASIRKDIETKRDEISKFTDRIINLFTWSTAVVGIVLAIGGIIGLFSLRSVKTLEKELRARFPSFLEAQKQLEGVTTELIRKYGRLEPGKQPSISEEEKIQIIYIEHQIYSLSVFAAGEQFKKDLSDGYTILGTFYFHIKVPQEERIESSIHFYRKALEYDKENPRAYFPLSFVLRRKAQMLSGKGKKKLARNVYEQALEKIDLGLKYDKFNAKALYNKGWILDEFDRYNDAIKAYLSAEKVDMIDPDIPYNIACAYAKMKKCKQAIEYLQKSINLDPDSKETAAQDEDFDNCRGVEEFEQLICTT